MHRSAITKFGFRIHLLAGIAAVSLAAPAMAQDAAEEEIIGNEIVVTATKRNETIQDVPFSINAQTADAMRKNGSTNLEDLSRNVAGLTVQNLGPGQSQVSIRGVSAGQIVRDQPGVKEQVGVYLDESVISLSLFTPDFDLFDLDRVETLRGPQGTLFGSGSVGGTVRYITKQPTSDRTEGAIEGNVNVLEGGDLGYSVKGAINLPLSDKMALRVVGYGEHFGGFIDAIGPAAGENINDGRRWGFRATLRWEPAEGMVITPRIIHQNVRVNGFNRQEKYNLYYNTLISPTQIFPERTQYLKLREGFEDSTTLFDLTGNFELTDNFQLTWVSSYIDRDILVSRDASALTGSVSVSPFIGLGINPSVVNLPSNLKDTTGLQQWTQEIRIGSTGNAPFQWVIGGFYSNVNRTYAQRLPTPGYDAFVDAALGAGTSTAVANGFPLNSPYNADLPYDIEQFALFGEASIRVGGFKFTAGGRYYDFSETRDFISGGIFSNSDTFRGDKTSSDGFSPRLIASFDVNENVTINAQASKGFRLGGVNDPLNAGLCTPADLALFGGFQDYEDETLWNYEVGVKAQGGIFTFNAAGFYNDIRNLQVTLDAGSCSSRISFNVPKAHSTGVEAEIGLRPAPGLEFSLAGSVIDSQFDTTLPGPLAAATGIRDGNRLPTVPKFQIAGTASYTTTVSDGLDWNLTGSFQHVGNRFTQPADQEAGAGTFTNSVWYNSVSNTAGTGAYNFGSYLLPSYNLVNLSTGLEWDNGLSLTVYVTNLFDENPLLSLDRERGGRARLGYNIGSPRKIGMTVRKSF
ncbi:MULTISPECIES: TonB-dependent receptor [unclassified Novosphingobium]|uniref:TonB-dependent receptor n=1 Tax=unclassified Novosphingobium TaxID=2644732 RepID=UPI000ED2B984|nr:MULTISPECIES: TonB-dependent receptor [unclassified Novosphingobium]HCF25288.1 TonB-dependent receptor [Novosphingobium sp.]HQV05075.1 TonB-dependent receptor [Novosphingobium sp.]